MAQVERSEAQLRVRNAMLVAGIPLSAVTARCMFEPTLAPTTGRNECQFGPTPLWDHLVGRNGNMPESELNEWIDKLVRSGQTRQAAASMGAKVEADPVFEIGRIGPLWERLSSTKVPKQPTSSIAKRWPRQRIPPSHVIENVSAINARASASGRSQ